MTSNTDPILVFPLIQPFGSDVSSSRGKVYSRQATETLNCENSSVSFVMKYCPTSTVVGNPASVQNLLNLSCCDSFSTRSLHVDNVVQVHRSKICVFIPVGTNNGWDNPARTSRPVPYGNCHILPTILNSFFSQTPRHRQRFPMVLPNFSKNCIIRQNLVEQVGDYKRFNKLLILSCIRGIQFRG